MKRRKGLLAAVLVTGGLLGAALPSSAAGVSPAGAVAAKHRPISIGKTNFGSRPLGSTSERIIRVTNTNSEAISITSISVTAQTGGFALDFGKRTCFPDNGPLLLPAGGSCDGIGILFTPKVPGRQRGTLCLLANVTASGANVSACKTLKGYGSAPHHH